MTDAGDGWSEAADWYPEIVAVGDAVRAWQAEFVNQAIPFPVRQHDPVNPRTAWAENGDRCAKLLLQPRQRGFYLALRAGRTVALQGYAADLAVTADAARGWLSGERPGQVTSAWPFLGSVALAEARERGDRREAAWLWLTENHCADQVGARLAAFLTLARLEPRLRALTPYTSHRVLHFSSTPQWPFRDDFPMVEPVGGAGRYVVRTRDRRVFAETDAAGALRQVLAELPE